MSAFLGFYKAKPQLHFISQRKVPVSCAVPGICRTQEQSKMANLCISEEICQCLEEGDAHNAEEAHLQ